MVATTIPLVLGTAQWSGNYGINNSSGAPEPSVAQAMLVTAMQAGMTTLDTARGYGDSEALIGASLRALDCSDAFKVVTKLHPDISGRGATAAEALANTGRSLATSRAALGRSVLDVVMLHRFEHLNVHRGVVWRRLRREREMETIAALGVSAANPDEAWSALEHPEIEVIQVAASLLDQRLARGGFFEAAEQAGKQIYLRSIFLQGVAFIPPGQLPRPLLGFSEPLRQIRRRATALGCSVVDLFVGYAATLAGCSAVVGCETVSQLREIVAARQETVASENTELNSASLSQLADRIVPLPARLLDPSRWSELPALPAVQPGTLAGSAAGSAPSPPVSPAKNQAVIGS